MICKRCGENKPDNAFYADKTRGCLRAICITCTKAKNKEYAENNKEKIREFQRAYREKLKANDYTPEKEYGRSYVYNSKGQIKCPVCGEYLEESDFYKVNKNYLRMPCKKCYIKKEKKKYHATKKQIRVQD